MRPGQNVTPDLYYLEVVDPETGRRLPDGESGMLAITHLHRRGTVLLRYLVGDIVTLSREPCPHCGRIGERVVRTPRRTGSLVKCRGMLVNTDVVIDVLSAVEAIGVFQIVFMRDDAPGAMDRMVIRIERDADDAGLRERLIADVQKAVSLRPEVEFARARRALRPGAVDQGAAGGRPAAEGGVNWGRRRCLETGAWRQVLGDRCLETGAWSHVGALNPVPMRHRFPGVDSVSAAPINVLFCSFDVAVDRGVRRTEQDACPTTGSRWSAGGRRPLARAPRPGTLTAQERTRVPEISASNRLSQSR